MRNNDYPSRAAWTLSPPLTVTEERHEHNRPDTAAPRNSFKIAAHRMPPTLAVSMNPFGASKEEEEEVPESTGRRKSVLETVSVDRNLVHR